MERGSTLYELLDAESNMSTARTIDAILSLISPKKHIPVVQM